MTNDTKARVESESEAKSRQLHNRSLAVTYAKAGIYVFPSIGDDKTPAIPMWQRRDSELTDEEREAAIAKRRRDGKREPLHVGATTDPRVVRALWNAFPDAVPSISCGPSGLLVIDADSKDNGPALLRKFFEANGGDISHDVPVVRSQSGGLHLYYRNDQKLGNTEGAFTELGCNIRGVGGQTVAPGAWRADGRRYRRDAEHVNLIEAWRGKSIPATPAFVVHAIGGSSKSEKPLNDADANFRDTLAELESDDREDYAALFDPTLGKYPLDYVRECRPDFGFLYDHPGEDRSTNRIKAACFLVGAYPELTAADYATFCQEWEGAGEYDSRQLAREYLKAKARPANVSKPSEGAAFGVVVEGDDRPEGVKRFDYIENIRSATLRFLDWCVKHFIARGTTSIASGQWGAGKTAVFSDIALHVAHGFEWRGRKVKKGVVVYVALENPEDVERRVRAWCEAMEAAGFDVSGGAFVIHRGPCCLYDPSNKPTRDEKDLIQIANTAAKHYGLPVSMVVLDTLSQSIAPGNDREHGGIYTASMQRIASATGANVTALHHPTKAGDQVRGDGAFQGNVDTVITIMRDKHGQGTVEAGSKFRIGDPKKVRFDYQLKSHVIGRDEDGEDIEVVLAVAPERGTAMGAVTDTDEEAPTILQPDRLQDRIRMVLDVFDSEARRQKAADETVAAARQRLELQSGEICSAVSERRRADGLEALGRSTIRDHIASAVEAASLEAVGTAARPAYRLA